MSSTVVQRYPYDDTAMNEKELTAAGLYLIVSVKRNGILVNSVFSKKEWVWDARYLKTTRCALWFNSRRRDEDIRAERIVDDEDKAS
jgi:hypothetical protein